MPALIVPGIPYRSKQALARVRGLNIGDQVIHTTPDGYAVLAPFAGGGPHVTVTVDAKLSAVMAGKEADAAIEKTQDFGPCLHVLRSDGCNLEHVVSAGGRLVVQTVKIPIDGLGDLERLVEYDHLPESRKDYNVYTRGHKLA